MRSWEFTTRCLDSSGKTCFSLVSSISARAGVHKPIASVTLNVSKIVWSGLTAIGTGSYPRQSYNRALMFRHVPNILTGSRLVLAGAFFVILSFYQYEGRGDPFLMTSAFIIYILALVSDFLDG